MDRRSFLAIGLTTGIGIATYGITTTVVAANRRRYVTTAPGEDLPMIRMDEKGQVLNPDFIFENIPWTHGKTWWGAANAWRETTAYLNEENAEYYISVDEFGEPRIQDAKYWGKVRVSQNLVGTPPPHCYISRIISNPLVKGSQTSNKNVNSPFGPTSYFRTPK